jgi:hypothetical protein
MNTLSAATNARVAGSKLPFNCQRFSIFLVAFGAMMIWLAPSLYGHGVLNASWCLSAHQTLMTQATNLTAQLLQHCFFCYLGAALIGAGFAMRGFSKTRRHS